jgi:hypothetical protein
LLSNHRFFALDIAAERSADGQLVEALFRYIEAQQGRCAGRSGFVRCLALQQLTVVLTMDLLAQDLNH